MDVAVLPNGDVLVAESNTEHGLMEKAGAVDAIGADNRTTCGKALTALLF